MLANEEKQTVDEGPFRAPQPAERRAPSREAIRQSAVVEEKPESATGAPKPYRSERTPIPPIKEPKKLVSLKRVLIPIIIVIILVGGGFVGATAWSQSHATVAAGIDTSKYQAVFFTNGQVYFGKLQTLNNDYLKLTDIFYLQTQSTSSKTDSTNPQSTSSDSSSVQLIKLGNEVHSPEDQMIISRDQVLFYENLKSDGKVSQSIDKAK